MLISLVDLALEFDTDKHVGPWVVRTEVVQDTTQSTETLLAKKAVLSMEAFMEGEVEYFVTASVTGTDAVQPLVFRSFSKADRPKAWKNCDLRIQTTLPLLGVDDSKVSNNDKATGEGFDKTEHLIRVSMALKQCDDEE